MEDEDTGYALIADNIKSVMGFELQQSLDLIGVVVDYWAPLEGSNKWDGHGEPNETYFYPPIKTSCFYINHLDQRTMKRIGWVSELDEQSRLILVDINLDKLQVGSLFRLPSAFDGDNGGIYKVIKMQAIPIYPVSITCEIAPVFETTYDKSQVVNEKGSSGLLVDVEDADDPRFNVLRNN